MKKHTERQPIDDLFARKLENMTLPPTADAFDRLQARIRQNKPEVRVVFWRNPGIQRYMAAAACLFLAFVFGWLFWPSNTRIAPDQTQIATSQNSTIRFNKASNGIPDHKMKKTGSDNVAPVDINQEQLAHVQEKSKGYKTDAYPTKQPVKINNAMVDQHQSVESGHSEVVVAQIKIVGSKTSPESVPAINVTPSAPDQVAVIDNKAAPAPVITTERVLVVTIDEPATLVAARQAVRASIDEKAAVDVSDKAEKEPKHGLWQQVKRIKQGELFARRDNADNDERGLLSRAYSGLKHSLDKDKSTKQ